VAKKAAGRSASRAAGSSTPATAALVEAGVAHTAHAYAHDAAVSAAVGYGLEAAHALGIDPERVYKTLVVEVDGALGVAVLPVSAKLDLKAVGAALGGKRAAMADPAAAERTTGYVRGGISPLGQRRRLPTVVDVSALEHPTVLVSGGRRGLDVELSPADLVRLTGADGRGAPGKRRSPSGGSRRGSGPATWRKVQDVPPSCHHGADDAPRAAVSPPPRERMSRAVRLLRRRGVPLVHADGRPGAGAGR